MHRDRLIMCRRTRLGVLTTLLATMITVKAERSDVMKFETVHNSNAAILQRLGLVPVRIPDGHHKKRLSGPEPSEDVMANPPVSHTRIHQPYSRRHGHRDSHVYVVKLPPNQPYYALTKPHKTSSQLHKNNDETPINIENSNSHIGFQSNGKPGKIYHWNLPLVKKVNERKKLHAQLKIDQMRKRLEEEMNDEQLENDKNVKHQLTEKTNMNLSNTTKKQTTNLEPSRNSSIADESHPKNYHHHHASVNSLNNDEKPIKHTRNNDKRLNYPRITDELGKYGRTEDSNKDKVMREDNEKTSKNNKKSYRLEDSNLYRLESWNNNERHKNDRLAVWSLSNELHASSNAQNSMRPKKHRKKAAMSYYAPINSRSNKIDSSTATNIQKYFPGNGKPKAFYVLEKSRQPVYYHPLLP